MRYDEEAEGRRPVVGTVYVDKYVGAAAFAADSRHHRSGRVGK